GRVPFNADTFNELLFKIALESPEPAELYAPGLDADFSQIIMRGMAREVNHRFQHAREFSQAIDGWMAMRGYSGTLPAMPSNPSMSSNPALGFPAVGANGRTSGPGWTQSPSFAGNAPSQLGPPGFSQ